MWQFFHKIASCFDSHSQNILDVRKKQDYKRSCSPCVHILLRFLLLLRYLQLYYSHTTQRYHYHSRIFYLYFYKLAIKVSLHYIAHFISSATHHHQDSVQVTHIVYFLPTRGYLRRLSVGQLYFSRTYVSGFLQSYPEDSVCPTNLLVALRASHELCGSTDNRSIFFLFFKGEKLTFFSSIFSFFRERITEVQSVNQTLSFFSEKQDN